MIVHKSNRMLLLCLTLSLMLTNFINHKSFLKLVLKGINLHLAHVCLSLEFGGEMAKFVTYLNGRVDIPGGMGRKDR